MEGLPKGITEQETCYYFSCRPSLPDDLVLDFVQFARGLVECFHECQDFWKCNKRESVREYVVEKADSKTTEVNAEEEVEATEPGPQPNMMSRHYVVAWRVVDCVAVFFLRFCMDNMRSSNASMRFRNLFLVHNDRLSVLVSLVGVSVEERVDERPHPARRLCGSGLAPRRLVGDGEDGRREHGTPLVGCLDDVLWGGRDPWAMSMGAEFI